MQIAVLASSSCLLVVLLARERSGARGAWVAAGVVGIFLLYGLLGWGLAAVLMLRRPSDASASEASLSEATLGVRPGVFWALDWGAVALGALVLCFALRSLGRDLLTWLSLAWAGASSLVVAQAVADLVFSPCLGQKAAAGRPRAATEE